MSSPSVTLNALSWSTPDGTTLFSELSLSFGAERTGLVGRNGTGKTTLLRLIAGEIEPAAGDVHASGTVAMLRQDVQARPGGTIADLLGVAPALDVLDRAETGRAEADELAEADWTLPARIESALCAAACRSTCGPRWSLSREGSARVPVSPRWSLPSRMCCCSMNRPTTSIAPGGRP